MKPGPVLSKKRLRHAAKMVKALYARLNPYSRIVFLLKIIIPVAGLSLFSFIMILPNLRRMQVQITVPRLDRDTGITFSIIEGRITGQGENGETFEIIASDFRENRQAATMFFHELYGRLTRPDETWLSLSAVDGVFNRDEQHFLLTGNVEVQDGEGIKIETERAEVDLTTNSVSGNVPVRVSAPFGFATGDSYKFIMHYSYRFFGRVEGRVNTDSLEAANRRRR